MKTDMEKIEQYVGDLLELSAVSNDGAEQDVYAALRHLLTAVCLYEQMDDDERELMIELKKKLQYFFSCSFSLKERKETKKKKNFPPNPLLKVKQKTETEEKTRPCVCDAKEAFRKECLAFVGQYDTQLLADFYNYYSEVNPRSGKMRFEEQRYWDTEKRLKRWVKNQ